MYGLTEEQLMASSDRQTHSNVVEIGFRRPGRRTERAVTTGLDWPISVQIAWDIAH
jgi:hypothetical protein